LDLVGPSSIELSLAMYLGIRGFVGLRSSFGPRIVGLHVGPWSGAHLI